MFDLCLLFLSALLAATIFPAQSEIILMGLLSLGDHNHYLLLLIATLGNVLGALLNWFLGIYFSKFKHKKWFPLSNGAFLKYSRIYQKYGSWSLLFAWLPIIGDPLTVIAGIFRTNIWKFLLLVTIGKALRYWVIILLL